MKITQTNAHILLLLKAVLLNSEIPASDVT